MAGEFGNINEMTKNDFSVAIEFFKKRIEAVKVDESLSDRQKNWFTKRFEKRITHLKDTYQNFALRLNELKKAGVFVNEKSATLNSIGVFAKEKGSFNNFKKGRSGYRFSQVLRVTGMFLLPVVGTIPLIFSFRRAKARRKEFDNAIKNENIEFGSFITSNDRKYESILTEPTALSEEHIKTILERNGEVARIEGILASPGLSPIEAKNLTNKLKQIRKFAQENGYTLPAGVLTDPVFRTKLDEHNAKFDQINRDAQSNFTTPGSAEPFNDAHRMFTALQAQKTAAKELLNAAPNDASKQRINNLISRIDQELEAHKTQANDFITSYSPAISSAISSAIATSNDLTVLKSSNTALDNAVAGAAGGGMSLKDAITMAKDMGIKVGDLETLQTSYESLKSSNDKKIGIIENLSNAATRLSEINTELGSLIPTSKIEDSTNTEEIDKLIEEAKKLINIEHDRITVSGYETAKGTFNVCKRKYEDLKVKKQLDDESISVTSLLDSFENKINLIDTSNPDSKDDLNTIISQLDSEDMRNKLTELKNPSLITRYQNLINDAVKKLNDVKTATETKKEHDKLFEKIKGMCDELDNFINNKIPKTFKTTNPDNISPIMSSIDGQLKTISDITRDLSIYPLTDSQKLEISIRLYGKGASLEKSKEKLKELKDKLEKSTSGKPKAR